MSKKIVYFDKEVFEQKIKGWIERRPYVTSKDFLLLIDGFITEIDTNQSIEERAKKYAGIPLDKDIDSEERYFNSNVREYDNYIKGATEQDLISKAREKEKRCDCANKNHDEQREVDIQSLCKYVLSISPECWDNPNGAYETMCPFCYVKEYRGGNVNNIWAKMSELKHNSDCAYLIAKDLSSNVK